MVNRSTLVERAELARLQIFDAVDLDRIEPLLHNLTVKVLAPGEVLIAEGENHRMLYLLLSGCLRLHLQSLDDPPVAMITVGETAGEMSLIDKQPSSAYVVADQACRVLVIDEATVKKLLATSAAVGNNLLTTLCQRLRAVNQMIYADRQQLSEQLKALQNERTARTLQRAERDRVAAELLRAQQQSAAEEAASQVKSDFLASVSHELRTPMNAIIGLSHLALQTGLDERQRDYLSKIEVSAQDLMALIDDMLDYSHMTAGSLELQNILFDPRQLLAGVHRCYVARASAKGLASRVSAVGDVPARVAGDPLRLQQILARLIDNAVKFTERGEILIAVERLDDECDSQVTLCFAVEDSGNGIDPEQLPELSQPFSQVGSSVNSEQRGIGLGLAISQRLVEMLGGRLQVRSRPGGGSRFDFALSLRTQSRPRPVSPGEPSPSLSASLSLPPSRVLVAEDNTVNQQVVAELLQSFGLQVDVVDNGYQAVERVLQNTYDLVLMDVQMPGMDGYQATREIRRRASSEQLPVIAITAHALARSREQALLAGMNDYLTKPIDPRLLHEKIAGFLPTPPYSSPEPTAAANEVVLPSPLPGIDVDAGLARLRGNRVAYRSVLRAFAKDHGDDPQRLQALLAEGQSKDAANMVHALKGAAGNLGATALYAVARDLEQALCDGSVEITVLVERCKKSHRQVFAGLERWLLQDASERHSGDSDKAPPGDLDSEALRAALTALETLVAASSFDVESSLITLEQSLTGNYNQQYLALQQALEQFDFGAAQAAINELRRLAL